ncbi:MAG: hypothetical protein ABR527_04065 [Gemmatimonadota bacterium]
MNDSTHELTVGAPLDEQVGQFQRRLSSEKVDSPRHPLDDRLAALFVGEHSQVLLEPPEDDLVLLTPRHDSLGLTAL